MDRLSMDALDFVYVLGDAYIDHPSFGTTLIARLLEAEGYRVAVLAQPDWHDCAAFAAMGKPRFGVFIGGGNLDSMVAHYTAAKKRRSEDYFTPKMAIGKRPDRAVIVYCNRIREAYGDVPIIIGGLEASLRRFAHYDYWDDRVRRSVLVDSRADLLEYGMGEATTLRVAELLDKIILSPVLAADTLGVGLLLLSEPRSKRRLVKLYPVLPGEGVDRSKLPDRVFRALHGTLREGRARIINAVAPACAHTVVHCHLGEVVLYLLCVHVEPAIILAPCYLAAVHRGDDLVVGMERAQLVIVQRGGLDCGGGLLRRSLRCLGRCRISGAFNAAAAGREREGQAHYNYQCYQFFHIILRIIVILC